MEILENRRDRASRADARRAAQFVCCGIAAAAAALLIFGAGRAEAGRHSLHRRGQPPSIGFVPEPVSESIVIDADTGRVLSQTNADALTYPASLTKLMTLYLTFENLNTGRLRLDQYLPVSAEAASRPPTKLGLFPGDQVQVRDLILGIVTRSANDAAAVLAEGQAGSVAAFAQLMTAKARQLGLTDTVYRNASGLPDPEQHTTARDVAQLALALYHDFPSEYHYFSTREFDFRGSIITNHNHLLEWYPGADGIKTGFIRASGFNLAASAVRDGHRLIGVVMGGRSAGRRDREMAALLDQGFEEVGVAIPVAERHQPPPVRLTFAAAAPPADRPQAKPALARKAAPRLVLDLEPATKEEAVLPSRERRGAAAERWSIQLGAFHAETAAQKAGHTVAGLRVTKGKPLQIVESGKTAKTRLYRARLLNFTQQGADSACAALHRKKIACTVVPPPPLKFANR